MRSAVAPNSRRKTRDGILGVISAKRAEDFIVELVNLPTDFRDEEDERVLLSYRRIASHYPEFLRGDEEILKFSQKVHRLLYHWSCELKFVWGKNERDLDWVAFRMRDRYMRESNVLVHHESTLFGDIVIGGAPPITPFEAAIFYFQTQLAPRRQLCPHPMCPARYFFRTKKGQKFCSTKCADLARREAKRRWWNENLGKGA